MNFIKDKPITCKDVNLTNKLYGPNQGSIKGRIIRKNTKLQQHKKIEIPSELIERNR